VNPNLKSAVLDGACRGILDRGKSDFSIGVSRGDTNRKRLAWGQLLDGFSAVANHQVAHFGKARVRKLKRF